MSRDGASENRSLFGMISTISATDILKKYWAEDELKKLGAGMKIGFKHPHPLFSSVTVLIGGEMPHWVKKFRNAFENKSRSLVFRGQNMSLQTLYRIWKSSGDADVRSGAGIRKYKFTHDHFDLNSFLKMRVFLAMNVFSQTMKRMITDHCIRDPKDQLEDFKPMIDLIDAVDRLVDIVNGINISKGKFRNVQQIDCPMHPHILELFWILELFVE